MSQLSNKNRFIIIYDGECPLCSRYVRMVRLQKSVGQVVLKDARSDLESAQKYKEKGYNLDNGMIVIYNENIYYGKDAVHIMSLLSTQSNLFNKINAALFKHKIFASMIYTVLVLLRKLLLKIINRKKIFSS